MVACPSQLSPMVIGPTLPYHKAPGYREDAVGQNIVSPLHTCRYTEDDDVSLGVCRPSRSSFLKLKALLGASNTAPQPISAI